MAEHMQSVKCVFSKETNTLFYN